MRIQKLVRKAACFMLTGTMIISLVGCSTPNGLFPPSAQEISQKNYEQAVQEMAQRENECNGAELLLSNLTKPINQRLYSVKPGEVCYA